MLSTEIMKFITPYSKEINLKQSDSEICLSLSKIFAVPQIKRTWYQNQSADINIFPGNFEEKYKCEKSTYQQFQIAIRSNSGNINKTEGLKYEILHEIAPYPQKKQHCQLKRGRSYPNLAGHRKRHNTRDKSEIKQHCNSPFFGLNHFFYENVLKGKKESCSDRNHVKDIELKYIIGIPSCNNSQSDKSDERDNPAKISNILPEKNFGQHQRKQRNRPKNNHNFGQRQLNDGINIEEKTHCPENSTNCVQKKLICFKCGFALGNHKRQQCNQSEEKSKKCHLKSVQPLTHKFRNNIIAATNKHLAEKESNPPPIPIQSHKLSADKSRLFITFMVKNENIF